MFIHGEVIHVDAVSEVDGNGIKSTSINYHVKDFC